MKPVYRLVFLLSGAFALGIIAGHGVSLKDSAAQGYEGLIAEQPNAKKPGPGELPGYKGLIPGYVPDDDAEEAKNMRPGMEEDVPQEARQVPVSPLLAPEAPRNNRAIAGMTPIPGREEKRVNSIEGMRMAGLEKPMNLDWEHAQIPPEIQQTLEKLVTPEQKATLAKMAPFRIEGLLADEYTTKIKIDSIMNYVNNPQLSEQERKANARKASEKLAAYSNYLRVRTSMPSSVLEKMGVPSNYMRSQHEALQNSVNRVEAALRTLKKYE